MLPPQNDATRRNTQRNAKYLKQRKPLALNALRWLRAPIPLRDARCAVDAAAFRRITGATPHRCGAQGCEVQAVMESNFSLTKIGQQMVADNMGLIGYVLNRRRGWQSVTGMTRRDLEQEMVLWLAKAAAYYQPATGFKFVTYAMTILHRALGTILHRCCMQTPYNEVRNSQEASSLHLLMLTSHYDNGIEHLEETEVAEWVMDHVASVTDGHMVIRRYMDDETLASMGTEMGLTKERVRQRIEQAINRVQDRIGDALPVQRRQRFQGARHTGSKNAGSSRPMHAQAARRSTSAARQPAPAQSRTHAAGRECAALSQPGAA